MENKPGICLYLKLVIFILLMHFSFHGEAQETVLSSSNDVNGAGGTVSYSVGQAAYVTLGGITGTMTEGVQQPYEILFMTGQEDRSAASLDCIVYPNPASSEVRLRIEHQLSGDENFLLRNGNGLILEERKIENMETIIPVENLAAGMYMLTLIEGNHETATWKIIKK
jgi:hypothetical protein